MAVLVIDVGSSSVRTVLVDEALSLIEATHYSLPYTFDTSEAEKSTVNPVWLREQVEHCIDQTLSVAGTEPINAVGMTTFVGNLMGVDDQNHPTTPVYTYADRRNVAALEKLGTRIDLQAAYQRTGCPPHTAYHPARLLWLQTTQPERYQQTHQWVDFATYCYRVWFGRDVPCSTSVASWGGMLNHHEKQWDTALLHALCMSPEDVPALADFRAVQTGLGSEYRERWPQLHEVPWYLAIGDGAAANIGSGGINPKQPVLTIGTTAALRVTTQDTLISQVPQGLWCYQIDQDRQLLGGATTEGGNVFAWARETLQLHGDVEQELAARTADGHGLTFLPLLAGERSPGYQANACGAIHGLQLNTTPLDILQAGLEGVAVRLAMIADMLVDVDAEFYAGGGALYRSGAWAQMIANAFDRKIHLLAEPEVTVRGIAALILGKEAEHPTIPVTLTPNPEATDRLRAVQERMKRLYAQNDITL